MDGIKKVSNISAARLVASTFGCLAGIGGITHGVGESLQGSAAPGGVVINSWTVGPIATNMGGEPAMTIIPNLLITGILTIIIALAVSVWSAGYVHKKKGGIVLVLLCIGMLLVGGGFAPPLLGIIAGVTGLGINAPAPRWCKNISDRLRRSLVMLWPWIFGISVVNGVFLVIGSIILVYAFGLNNPDLFVNSFFFAIVSVILSAMTGAAYDFQNGKRE